MINKIINYFLNKKKSKQILKYQLPSMSKEMNLNINKIYSFYYKHISGTRFTLIKHNFELLKLFNINNLENYPLFLMYNSKNYIIFSNINFKLFYYISNDQILFLNPYKDDLIINDNNSLNDVFLIVRKYILEKLIPDAELIMKEEL